MLDTIIVQASQLMQHPYVLYGVLVTASACLVFGVAALLEPRPVVAPSVRRGNSMQWAVTRFSSGLVPEDAREHNELKRSLVQAGFDAPNAVQVYYGIRVILAIGLPAMLLLALPAFGITEKTALFIAPFLAIFGFLAPIYWVSSRRRSRQRQFREGLPDVLDLLLVCSEAGLGIDTALLKVSEETSDPHPLLAHELALISSELRAGLVRAEAMRHFADRTGIDETISLVNLLVQSDALGTSMATTLRAFSQDMRAHRMLRAEDLGHRVGAKLTMVLVGCFLPAMFAALLAPAVYSAITKLQGLSVSAPWPQ
jgi:tight adherence protein C